MSVWLVIGTSPDAKDMFREFQREQTFFNVSITTNAGLDVMGSLLPTYYWVSDPRAIAKYRDRYAPLARLSTRIVTSKWIADPRITKLDPILLDVPVTFPPAKRPFKEAEYVNGRTSGSIMLQFAVNSGATVVHLIGMSGWKPPIKVDVMEFHVPVVRSVITRSPQTRFVWWGQPNHDLPDVENVEIIRGRQNDRAGRIGAVAGPGADRIVEAKIPCRGDERGRPGYRTA